MIRAIVPWARGAAPRAGLCLTLAVAMLSAGELLAEEVLWPVLPPVSEPGAAPAFSPGDRLGAAEPMSGEGLAGSAASSAGPASDGASRLLGEIAGGGPTPEAVSGGPGGIPACPRDVLTRLLADAAGRDDVLSVLAIEREMLKLCHERQKVIAGIDVGIPVRGTDGRKE